MTSRFLENVKVHLFSQAMSRYCMIYFGYSPHKRIPIFRVIIYKKSDIKKTYLLLLFHGLSFDILEKNKKKIGVTRLIILQEGQSYPHPCKFRG